MTSQTPGGRSIHLSYGEPMESQGHILGTQLALALYQYCLGQIQAPLVTSLPSSCRMTQFGGGFLSLNDAKFCATAPDPVSQCSTQFQGKYPGKKLTLMKLQRGLFLPSFPSHTVQKNNHLTLASLQINFYRRYVEPFCQDTRIKCGISARVDNPAYPEKTAEISRR